MATATIEVPHVYTGIAEILKGLSVEKNGVLPGNMGSKPYITAVDASAEVKRQFVANDLIFLPDEETIKHEVIIHKDRINTSIVIKGTYTIVSTVDGSMVQVSGTGDGLATGTAVASNIASTNALKNALLRTFLITEQSVEDEAKNGANADHSPTAQKLDKARSGPTAPAAKAPSSGSQSKVRDWISGDAERRDKANATYKRLKETEKLTGAKLWDEVLKELGI